MNSLIRNTNLEHSDMKAVSPSSGAETFAGMNYDQTERSMCTSSYQMSVSKVLLFPRQGQFLGPSQNPLSTSVPKLCLEASVQRDSTGTAYTSTCPTHPPIQVPARVLGLPSKITAVCSIKNSAADNLTAPVNKDESAEGTFVQVRRADPPSKPTFHPSSNALVLAPQGSSGERVANERI